MLGYLTLCLGQGGFSVFKKIKGLHWKVAFLVYKIIDLRKSQNLNIF